MRIQLPVLAVAALVGICNQACAEAQCPELIRLRHETAMASKQTIGVPTSQRCESYNRVSTAWDAVVQYAADHREACNISSASLDDLEKYHRGALEARDNVCAGRPARPFPPDIIQR